MIIVFNAKFMYAYEYLSIASIIIGCGFVIGSYIFKVVVASNYYLKNKKIIQLGDKKRAYFNSFQFKLIIEWLIMLLMCMFFVWFLILLIEYSTYDYKNVFLVFIVILFLALVLGLMTNLNNLTNITIIQDGVSLCGISLRWNKKNTFSKMIYYIMIFSGIFFIMLSVLSSVNVLTKIQ